MFIAFSGPFNNDTDYKKGHVTYSVVIDCLFATKSYLYSFVCLKCITTESNFLSIGALRNNQYGT